MGGEVAQSAGEKCACGYLWCNKVYVVCLSCLKFHAVFIAIHPDLPTLRSNTVFMWVTVLAYMALQCLADAPGVTQIIYPFGPAGDPDDGVQYMRVLDRRRVLSDSCSTYLHEFHCFPADYHAYMAGKPCVSLGNYRTTSTESRKTIIIGP